MAAETALGAQENHIIDVGQCGDGMKNTGQSFHALGWLLLILTMAICAAAVWYGPSALASIKFASPWSEVSAFYGVIFGPMLFCGLTASWLSKLSPFPLGRSPALWGLVGLVAGATGLALSFLDARLANIVVDGRGGSLGITALLGGVGITLFQCLSEEVLFRGWAQSFLMKQVGALAGILLASLLFMGFHLIGAPLSPLAMLNLFLGGILFGLFAWRSGGIIAPFAAHFAWNVTEDVGLGLVPNPGVGGFGAIIDYDLVGRSLWGGSAEGLNASLGTSLVLVALCLPLVWRSKPIGSGAHGQHQPDPAAV